MNAYFYSLGMLVKGPNELPHLTMMDVLADAIADEEAVPPKALTDWIESCQKARRK